MWNVKEEIGNWVVENWMWVGKDLGLKIEIEIEIKIWGIGNWESFESEEKNSVGG